MAVAQFKPAFVEDASAPVTRFAAEAEQVTAAPSPALLLQQRLQAGTALAPDAGKWPLRNSLALIVAASLGLWLAILTAVAQIAHAIA